MAKKQQDNEVIEGQPVEDDLFAQPKLDLTLTPKDAKAILDRVLPTGQETPIKELVGYDLVLRVVRPFRGKYGPALYCTFTDANGAVYSSVVGGQVIAPKVWALRNDLPVSLRLAWVEGGQYEGYIDIE